MLAVGVLHAELSPDGEVDGDVSAGHGEAVRLAVLPATDARSGSDEQLHSMNSPAWVFVGRGNGGLRALWPI